MSSEIIIFKNDAVGDLTHSLYAINNIIINNKDKNIIISVSFIEQQKGAQVHAHDLPHSLEVPAADSHEDHRALPEVLEEEGHR